MQDIECQQLVIPLPKRRRVVAAVDAKPPAPPHTEHLTCASVVSMYLPVPSIDVPCARGLYDGMVHRVLARHVADVPVLDAPETLPLADDPCSVVAGMLILASQSGLGHETGPASPERPSTLSVVLSGDHEHDSAPVEAHEVPLLPPELCSTRGRDTLLGSMLQELAPGVSAVSVDFDTAVAEQQLAQDLAHTLGVPDATTPLPSFVSLILDDSWAQHNQVHELEVPVMQVHKHECVRDGLHPAAVLQALACDLVTTEDSAECCSITPSMTFDQLLCQECRLQLSVPVPTRDTLMDQLLRCPPSRPSSVESREAPLLLPCSTPSWTRELARECLPCTEDDDNEMPPVFPPAEQGWSAVVKGDLVPPWSTVARLCVPELPAVFWQSHNLTQMSVITAALLTPEQEQTALRQRIELSLPPFWSSTRMTALKQNLCLRGIGTTGAPAAQLAHPTATEVLLRHEATLVTDRPASRCETTLAFAHDVPVLPSPGRLSVSPLDNFMRLRGCTPRKVDSQPVVSVPAPASTTTEAARQIAQTPLTLLVLPPLAVSIGTLVLLLLANMPRGRRCVFLCESDDSVARVQRWLARSEEAYGLCWEQRVDVVNTKSQFVRSRDSSSTNFLAIAEPVPESQLASSAVCELVQQLVDSHTAEHGLLPVLFSGGSILDTLGKEMCGAMCLGTPATPWALTQVLLSDTELDALLQVKQESAQQQQPTLLATARDTLLWDGPQALVQRVPPTAAGTALATLAEELDAGVVDDHRPLCDAVAAVLCANPPVLGSKALVVLPCADTAARMLAQLRAVPSPQRLSFGTWDTYGCNCCCAAVHDVLAACSCGALAAVSEVVLVAHPAGFAASSEVFALNELLPPSAHRSVVAVRALAIHEQCRVWWQQQQQQGASEGVPMCVLEPRNPVFCTQALLDSEFSAELVRCGWRPVPWRPSSSATALPVLVVSAAHSLVVLHGDTLCAVLAGTIPALPVGVSREWPLFTHCTVVVVAADPVQLATAGTALQHAASGQCLSLRYATTLRQAAALASGLLAPAPRAVLTRAERFWALLGADPLWVQTRAADDDPVAELVRRVAGFDSRGSRALAQLLRCRSATQTPAEPPRDKTDSVLDSIMYRATASPRATTPERPPTLSCCLPRGASHGQTYLCWVPSPTPLPPPPQPPLQPQRPPKAARVSVRDAMLQRISDFFSYKED